MTRYELTKAALADLDELWLYIAEDNVDAADCLIDSIFDACALLVEHPFIGHRRTDLVERPVLFWNVGKYMSIGLKPSL